jgi:predicted lipoprotein with Yx(FWY)xxD motif
VNPRTAIVRTSRRHRLTRFATTAALLGAGFAFTAAAIPGPANAANVATVKLASHGSLGKILVSSAGKTLYRFTADHPNMAACTGACTGTWPPLLIAKGTKPMAGSGVSGLGTIAAGSKLQVTFKKHPLYTYVLDTAAGDTNGQGVSDHGGTWFAATSSLAVATAVKSKSSTGKAPSGGYGY